MLPAYERETAPPVYKTRAKSWTAFDTAATHSHHVAPLTHTSTDSSSSRSARSVGAGGATGATATHRCPEPDCFRKFNRRYTLVEHMKTHTGEKPHVCPAAGCSKRFSTSGNLSRHKRLHGYIEPLECPIVGCPSTFASNNKLEKHMQYHLGSLVHVCKIGTCGKTFSTTGNLNRHMKRHHPSECHHQHESDSSFASTNEFRSQRTSSAPPAHHPFQSPAAADDQCSSRNRSSAEYGAREQYVQRASGGNRDAASASFPRIHPTGTSVRGSDSLLDSLATIFADDATLAPSPLAAAVPLSSHFVLDHQPYAYDPRHHNNDSNYHHSSSSFSNNSNSNHVMHLGDHVAAAARETEHLQKQSLLDDMIDFHVTNFQC